MLQGHTILNRDDSDLTDARAAGKAVLAGWTLEHECGPIPQDAKSVRLIAGTKLEMDSFNFPIGGGSQSGVTMTNLGDKVKFSGVKVTFLKIK